jgi:serine protease
MATPHVSGVVALMLSYKPDATPTELYNAMTSTAENPNTSGRDDRYGHGIINAMTAIQALSGGVVDSPPENEEGGDCENDKIDFLFNLQTDDYGYETSWDLVDGTTGLTVVSGAEATYGNNYDVSTQRCLNANNCYTLTIYDSYGDGMCCGQNTPGFQVRVDGQVIQNNQEFTTSIVIPGIGNCSNNNNAPTNPPVSNPTNPPVSTPPPTSPPVPPPTPPPTSRECCFLVFCWSC